MFQGIIIFIFFIFAFFGIFFIGLNYYSNGKVYGEEKKKKIGKRLMILPFAILVSYVSLFFVYQKISFKPNENDIIGKYKISNVSNIGIEKSEFADYNLELKKNGEFYFKNIPEIDICTNGKYNLHNFKDENGIDFKCIGTQNSAKIVSSLTSFEIVFISGDPDSEENVSYKKIEN